MHEDDLDYICYHCEITCITATSAGELLNLYVIVWKLKTNNYISVSFLRVCVLEAKSKRLNDNA